MNIIRPLNGRSQLFDDKEVERFIGNEYFSSILDGFWVTLEK